MTSVISLAIWFIVLPLLLFYWNGAGYLVILSIKHGDSGTVLPLFV